MSCRLYVGENGHSGILVQKIVELVSSLEGDENVSTTIWGKECIGPIKSRGIV